MIDGLQAVGAVGGILIFDMPSSRPGVPPHGFYWAFIRGWLYCECEGFRMRRLRATMQGGGCRHCREFRKWMSGKGEDS